MARKTAQPSRRPKLAPPPPPAFATALAHLPQRRALHEDADTLLALEESFGWVFPPAARHLLVGIQAFDLNAGCARVLDLDGMRRMNGLTDAAVDAVGWTCRRLGLFAFAADEQGNRFVMDVADTSKNAPVYWVSARLGLAGSATPVFPHAHDCLHAFALYTSGTDALAARDDVERLTHELTELRKRRPTPQFGRDEALARLQAAFGGGAKTVEAAAVSPEEESKLIAEYEAAKDRAKNLWMPFIEQFSRWHLYWRLLWNGPASLTVATDSLDVPLILSWRAAAPLGQAIITGNMDAVTTELQGRTHVLHPRALVAVAEARALIGDAAGARAAVDAWDEAVCGPKPPLLTRVVSSKISDAAPSKHDVHWAKALGRKDAERFLLALSAQFCSDLKKHGTTNILGATKASVREGPDGKIVVEAGLNNVPLEVRKPLFEGKPVKLSGQFLKALTRELCRRLHEPKVKVDQTLTKLRNVVEEHINAHVNLNIPHVGTFRIKNEPAATGASRFYLILDVAPELLAAAQQATVHRVSADFHADVPYG